MHYKGRVRGHQKQEAQYLKDQLQKHNNRPTRIHPKTVQKSRTHKQYIHHQNGPCINNSTNRDKTPNNGEDIT